MPRLYNKGAGRWEYLPNEALPDAIASGQFEVPEELRVGVTTDTGRVVEAAPGELAAARDVGAVATTPERLAAERRVRIERERGGLGQAIATVLEQGASGATLGATDVLGGLVGGEDYREARAEREEVRPGLATASRIGGGIAAAAATGGTGLVGGVARATPAGLAARAGTAIARGGSAGIGRAALGDGVEGALGGLGEGVHELAISEEPLSIERVASTLTSRALIGGATGAALGAVGKAAEKGLVRAKRAIDEAKAAREAARQASGGAAITDDVAAMNVHEARTAERAELDRIEQERIPEREAVVADMIAARQLAKTERPWEALAPFKDRAPKRARGAASEGDIAPAPERPLVIEPPAPKRPTGKIASSSFELPMAEDELGVVAATAAPTPTAPAQTWREFVAENMAAEMKSTGSHGAAMKALGEKWRARATPAAAPGEGAGTATMRIQVTSRNGAAPHWEELATDIVPDQPISTFVRMQKRVKGGGVPGERGWLDVGTATLRHRPNGELALDDINVLPGLQRRGLATRMLEAAEARTGRRLAGAAGPATPEGARLLERFAAGRDAALLARAESRAPTLPSYERVSGLGEVTKNLRIKDLAAQAVGFEGRPPNLKRVKEGMAAGTKFEPIRLSVDKLGRYSVDDGRARLIAAHALGRRTIRARITPVASVEHAFSAPVFPKLYRAGAAKRARVPRGIAGVPPELQHEFAELAKVSFKADKRLDNLLDNPKVLAERAQPALDTLKQQEHALARLQAIAPDLRRLLPPNAKRLHAALDTLQVNLERNRALQGRLERVLADPNSPRLAALRAHRDELIARGGQPKSLAESIVQGGVYATVATAAGPLGMAAPIVGGVAARKVSGWIFGRMASAGRAAAERSQRALERFLSTSARAIRAATPTATRILSRISFAPPGAERPRQPRTLPEAYKARSEELLAQVELGDDGQLHMTPQARAQVADNLSGVAAMSPTLADKLETQVARKVEYAAQALPKEPDLPGGFGPEGWQPGEREIRTWARIAAAVEDPGGVEERLADGIIIPEEAQAYRAVWPERFVDFRSRMMAEYSAIEERVPYARRMALSIFLGAPVDPALTPPVAAIMQSVYGEEPGTEGGTRAPRPTPQFGSVRAEDLGLTRAQQRAAK